MNNVNESFKNEIDKNNLGSYFDTFDGVLRCNFGEHFWPISNNKIFLPEDPNDRLDREKILEFYEKGNMLGDWFDLTNANEHLFVEAIKLKK